MAQLAKTSHTFKIDPSLKLMDRIAAETQAMDKLEKEKEIVRFGVADGFAHYIVKSRKPLVLQHVDYMDGYHAPGALIRGLRLSDIDGNIRRSKMGFKF